MANTFTSPVFIKAKPHAGAEKQVGDADPSVRTDVVNRVEKGMYAIFQRIVNSLFNGVTLDFTDQATTTALTGTSMTISGDGTAGRVLRALTITILNGTNASTVKCTTTSIWNGDANGVVDNIAKGATTGIYTLNAGGTTLTILNAGISGNAVAVLSAKITYNASATVTTSGVEKTASGIDITLCNAATGAALDMTTLVDTGSLYLTITYLTTA